MANRERKPQRWVPKNPKKYVGDPNNIWSRSGWERRFMQFCDEQSGILRWASEEIAIPYYNPVKERMARYFIDFWVEYKTPDGKIHRCLVEIKPAKEVIRPEKKPGKSYAKLLNESMTYEVNEAKWTAAKEFCSKHGFEFKIMTEYELGLKKRPVR